MTNQKADSFSTLVTWGGVSGALHLRERTIHKVGLSLGASGLVPLACLPVPETWQWQRVRVLSSQ